VSLLGDEVNTEFNDRSLIGLELWYSRHSVGLWGQRLCCVFLTMFPA
jgi:hypothetical protein